MGDTVRGAVRVCEGRFVTCVTTRPTTTATDRDDNHALAVGIEPPRPLLASSLDEDGAVRMFKNLARDTPVEQPRQPCLTPRSDDDEVG